MSGFESIIIYTAGGLLLTITASRFLIQESITLVKLFKELRAEVRKPLPPVLQPEATSDAHSNVVSSVSVRSRAE
jgi:hypothetical protein